MEFALAWPIVLLLVLGAVQLAIWASESSLVRCSWPSGRASRRLREVPFWRERARELLPAQGPIWRPG